MKNTIDAVRYGIETLKVSPEEMFSLIENSNGYEGDDYRRWLANEIIKLAEEDGVGFSQLLVKKFSIISTITEGLDTPIKQDWIDQFKRLLKCDTIVSANFPEVGLETEYNFWLDEADTLAETPFKNALEAIEGVNLSVPYAFVAKLESTACGKTSGLYQMAKEWGITCKNEGSLLLYRMCNFIEMSNIGSEFKFAFLANTDFLCDEGNKEIIEYFLKYFNYEGIVISSMDLMQDSYTSGEYAFCICKPRVKPIQDGFVLSTVHEVEGKWVSTGIKKRYSRSNISMLQMLKDMVREDEETWGWLSVPSSQAYRCTVGDIADASADVNIPITANNLEYVIVYYSVVHSLGQNGMATNINKVLTGSREYGNLLYNCLPLFVFNTNSHCSQNGKLGSMSEIILSMLEKGAVYFSYESKDLLEVCKGFLTFLGDSAKGLTFEEVRKEANHDGLNESYMSSLINIKDYIRSVYRKME